VVATLLSFADILHISQSLVSAHRLSRWEPATCHLTAAPTVVYKLRVVRQSGHLLSVASIIIDVSVYPEISSKISKLIRIAIALSIDSIGPLLYSAVDTSSALKRVPETSTDLLWLALPSVKLVQATAMETA
jgi:hypothetical protein